MKAIEGKTETIRTPPLETGFFLRRNVNQSPLKNNCGYRLLAC